MGQSISKIRDLGEVIGFSLLFLEEFPLAPSNIVTIRMPSIKIPLFDKWLFILEVVSVDVEKELTEGWKKVGKLQQQITGEDIDLEGQIVMLEEDIGELSKAVNKKGTRIDLLACLCLLSEICSAIDFDRMIDAREKFQDLLPRHFEYYLSHLESAPWHIGWSGCLGCIHFSAKCTLNLTPQEVSESEEQIKKFCPSRSLRSHNL